MDEEGRAKTLLVLIGVGAAGTACCGNAGPGSTPGCGAVEGLVWKGGGAVLGSCWLLLSGAARRCACCAWQALLDAWFRLSRWRTAPARRSGRQPAAHSPLLLPRIPGLPPRSWETAPQVPPSLRGRGGSEWAPAESGRVRLPAGTPSRCWQHLLHLLVPLTLTLCIRS